VKSSKANYGIDAPRTVRNLFVFSILALVMTVLSFQMHHPVWFWIVFIYSFPTCLLLFATGCWMLYGIKVTKPKMITKVIQELQLVGNEKLLDLGCGRGQVLCEAAKVLPHGEAHGIDLWVAKDQSGNCEQATRDNAEQEGVASRVFLHTGDIRKLPFSDETFDVVTASLSVHNISKKEGREEALLELLRVLKPGGRFVIMDIQHVKEYEAFFQAQGLDVVCSKPSYAYCPPMTTITGSKE